jgi:hypothetical protein
MELWLIRTSRNEIAGPYTRDRLLDLIRGGSLSFRDEVCRANDYWIGLNELDEVRSKLGSEVPELLRAAVRKKSKLGGGDAASDLTDELTQDVETEVPTEPEVQVAGWEDAPSPVPHNPWFGAPAGARIEPTQIRKGPSVLPTAPVRPPAPPLPESSIFRAFGVSLALLALVALYWVIRILRAE